MAKKELIKETKTLEEWKELKMPTVYFKTAEHVPGRVSVNSLNGGHIGYSSAVRIDYFNDKSWLFNSAKVLNGWAVGEVLTEEEFDAGIEKSANHTPRKR